MEPNFHQYHRNTDPVTSRQAAKALNLDVTEKHRKVLHILEDLWVASDDQIAEEAVNAGIVERHEQARRLVRTLRDKKFIEAALDEETGWQKSRLNSSGRCGLAWQLSTAGYRLLKAS
jgi:hypothetical protein